jgi:hypothetical protein
VLNFQWPVKLPRIPNPKNLIPRNVPYLFDQEISFKHFPPRTDNDSSEVTHEMASFIYCSFFTAA